LLLIDDTLGFGICNRSLIVFLVFSFHEIFIKPHAELLAAICLGNQKGKGRQQDKFFLKKYPSMNL
jgi:hypothetical protein